MTDELLIIDQGANIHKIGISDYQSLEDKPSLNGVTVEGNKTSADYGIGTITSVDGVAPSDGSVNTSLINVRFSQAKNAEPNDLYLDTETESYMPSNRCSLNPYTDIADLQTSSRYTDGLVIHVTDGSNIRQDVTISNINNLILQSISGVDVGNAVISGNLTLVNCGDIMIEGFTITGNVTINGTGTIELSKCYVQGTVQGYTEGYLAVYNTTFFNTFTAQGTNEFEVYFEACYGENGATLINQNPNCTFTVIECLELYIHSPQGHLQLRDSMIFGLTATTTGIIDLQSGTCVDANNNAELAPITVSSACTGMNTGVFVYKRTGSTIAGKWISGGIGSLQVRENDLYVNIVPRHDPADGTDPTRPVNTVKDYLKGIDDAIGNLITAAAGVKAVGVVGTDLVFYADAAKLQPIGAIPLSDLSNFSGSDSIDIIEGVISVNLTSGSLFHALEAKISDDAYVHTDENFTTPLQNKLSSLSYIISVPTANGLSLTNGILVFTPNRNTINLSDSCNGSTLVFNGTFTNSTKAIVYLNGLKLCQGTNYTITDAVLTLTTTAPPTGSILEVELF
jgi:hypothetical protein